MQNWLYNMEWAIGLRYDWLTPVFKGFSALGYGGFFLIFLPIGYWIINKNIFARVGVLLLLSAVLNAYLKDLFQDARPDPIFHLDPGIGLLSYGFPSGHAQIATVIWLWIAWEARKPWVWVLSSILVVGICFSRLYLGVHDVEDVLGGIGFGLFSLLIFGILTSKKFKWRHRFDHSRQIAAIAAIEAFFYLTWPEKLSGVEVGYGLLLLGFWAGVGVEQKHLFFEKHQDKWRIIASGIIGMIGFMALNKGFQAVAEIFESKKTAIVLAQALVMGLYITAPAPWIFQRLKLAYKGKPSE